MPLRALRALRVPAATLLLLAAVAPLRSLEAQRAPGAPAALREQTADQQLHHVLNRLAFGARPGEVEAVRAMGVDAWIERQLRPETIPDSAMTAFLSAYTTLDMSGTELLAAFPPPGAVQAQLARQGGGMVAPGDSVRLREAGRASARMVGELGSSRVARAVGSERQLEEVLVDFWSNHFSIFSGKDRTRYFLPEYDALAIRPHAMGTFRALLGAVAQSPAMLTYLDNWQSVADSGRPVLQPVNARVNARVTARGARRRAAAVAAQRNPQLAQLAGRRRGVNENYARELLELHTLGVDGGYTQQDVMEVARAFTGWTLARGAQGGGFVFRPQLHDAGAKVILGTRFPAGRGQEEGEAVLDLLARHPSTARFIATKLARRFVSDTPPPALVARAAETFSRTDGDIRAVVRTIVTSPEFFSTAAYRAKVKSPFELVTSALRAMGAAPDATPRTAQLLGRLGQAPFGHQAPNGYPELGDAWMNTGAILSRINFGVAMGAGRVPGVRLAAWPAAKELARLPREQQVEGVIRELLGGDVSADTRQVLLSGTNPLLARQGAADSSGMDARPLPPARGLAQVVGLALGAPEFQRR
ncbi:MAG: hypothetical protein RLZ32_2198 [Gemmatimonadota bacterium]